jgi:hypothetical protein
MKHCRRVISHHGSDCPDGPHLFKQGRCMILTRIDRPGERSRAWVSGDCAETMPLRIRREQWAADPEYAAALPSERIQRKDHTFDPGRPTWYGGGFWERVSIGPIEGGS